MSRIDSPCTDPRPDRREALALLAGGDLPPEEAARLEVHAGTCPACRELLAGLRESGAALALLGEEDLESDRRALARVREGVRAGVAEIEAEREEREGLGAPPRWALAAVLLMALVAAALWLRSGPGAGPGRDRAEEPLVEQAAERAREVAPPSMAEEAPRAPDTGPPPADRVAQAAPAGSTAAPSASGPDVPDAPRGEADPADPVAAAGMSDEARPSEPETEPQITIRIVSDDPDIVFYWLVEPEENRDEETVSS